MSVLEAAYADGQLAALHKLGMAQPSLGSVGIKSPVKAPGLPTAAPMPKAPGAGGGATKLPMPSLNTNPAPSLGQQAAKLAASSLRQRFRVQPRAKGFDAFLGDKQIGYMDLRPSLDGTGVAQIRGVEINPQFRGMGLGRKFYGEVMRRLPSGQLESGAVVSPDANRVWKHLERNPAYTVERNPGAVTHQRNGTEEIGLGRNHFMEQMERRIDGLPRLPEAIFKGSITPKARLTGRVPNGAAKIAMPQPTHPVVKGSQLLSGKAPETPVITQAVTTPQTIKSVFDVHEQSKSRLEPANKLADELCTSCRKARHYGPCLKPARTPPAGTPMKRAGFNFGMLGSDANSENLPATSGAYSASTVSPEPARSFGNTVPATNNNETVSIDQLGVLPDGEPAALG